MFTFRWISHQILPRLVFSQSRRCLLVGATNLQSNLEPNPSTVNLIKEDLRLIHGDILQVSSFDFY